MTDEVLQALVSRISKSAAAADSLAETDRAVGRRGSAAEWEARAIAYRDVLSMLAEAREDTTTQQREVFPKAA